MAVSYNRPLFRDLEMLNSQSAPQNFTLWSEFFAYDVMSDLAFSEDFGMLKEAKPHPYIPALHDATRLLVIASQTPWIRPLMPWFPIEAKSKIAGKEFARISRETYLRRKARQVKEPDMYEYIASPDRSGPRPLTEAEVVADSARKCLQGIYRNLLKAM